MSYKNLGLVKNKSFISTESKYLKKKKNLLEIKSLNYSNQEKLMNPN